jgi:hypothetical protein
MGVPRIILTLSSIILKAIDVVTTYLFVNKMGIAVEANPIVRESINYFGLIQALSLNFAYSVLVIILAHKLKLKRAQWGVAIILLLVCINNITQMILFWE